MGDLSDDLINFGVEDSSSLDNVNNDSLTEPSFMENVIPSLSYLPNNEIPAACDAIKIHCNESMGRHIIAVKDINPGKLYFIHFSFL